MKQTLTALALLATFATGANASMPLHAAHNEGLQNFYYYFGAPCCERMASAAPCGAAPCAAPVAECGACGPTMVPVEYEQVCTTCNPCGSSMVWWNPLTYFG